MVVNNFNIFRSRRRPSKADAPLVVDADGVLTLPAAFEGFQPIPGRDAQVVEATGDLQLSQLSTRHAANAVESSDVITASQGLRIGASERSNHDR